MREWQVWILVAALCCLASGAMAELTRVEVGGQLTLYGEWYVDGWPVDSRVRWPGSALFGRSIGSEDNAVSSFFGFDDDESGSAYVTQWTRLHVNAVFEGGVSAYIEVDQQQSWGDGFRSSYFTGEDGSGTGDVKLYQAYIELADIGGLPLRVRAGRQELVFGNEFLMGNNDYASVPYFGLSFDGLRLTYAPGEITLDAFVAKLSGGVETGDDIYLGGLHGVWATSEALSLSGYWLWLHDGTPIATPTSTLSGPWLERALGVEDYGSTDLHTVGAHVTYTWDAYTLDAEIAYQWGEATHAGALFRPGLYGDDEAEYGAWALHVNASREFDARWTPSLYVAYTYLGGEDKRYLSAADWLAASLYPYYKGRASLSFNRLFSDFLLGSFLDASDLTGVQAFVAGGSVAPSDAVSMDVEVMHVRALDAFERPTFPFLSFISTSNDKELGWETYLGLNYTYSEDLAFTLGWSHFFTGKGAAQGHFIVSNGFDFLGGSAQDDLDYIFFTTTLSF